MPDIHTILTASEVMSILDQVKDPEIPVLSVTDLGIVRELVPLKDPDGWKVVITPTYMGCPAMDVIAAEIRMLLMSRGAGTVTVERSWSPAWTTDWMTESGKRKLERYGIAPPAMRGIPDAPVACPQCGSTQTRLVSAFGSTACKALYQCCDCAEPFDHFKCI
jgi:ring-1,2-phenylacetyl-CoA epoxidase subunit PaaD